MKTLLVTTLLVCVAVPAHAQMKDPDKTARGVAYLALYEKECNTTLSEKTVFLLDVTIELLGKVKVMAAIMRADEERKNIGNTAFCAIVKENFASSLR